MTDVNGLPQPPVSRRDVLRLGLAGVAGLSLDQLLRAEAAQADEGSAKTPPRAQSVIHIFLPGGCAAQESFDPKPFAPVEYRGELRAIPTALAGVRFSALLPRCAKIANKITVCRAMSHGEAAHERGVHNMFTGYRPSPALVYPSLGSIVSHELGARKKLPPYVCLPNQPTTFAGSGYLSSAYAPFSLGADPAKKGFRVRDLNPPKGIDPRRSKRRRELLDIVGDFFQARDKAADVVAMDSFYKWAYDLIGSRHAREAFDLTKEPKKLRDRYGRHDAGQRFLMARRLVEAGVRFVSVSYGGWDMHDKVATGMRRLLPRFDQAFAALINDLDARGLLDSTLVMVSSEFGRTPKLNKTGGRDHWPKVFSVVLAGGGIKRGSIYGKTDATATEPEEDALSVEDWATTVYHLLGVDPHKRLRSPGGRPVFIVKNGKVRHELLG